ncbi:MAG: hypothetical protein AAGG07_04695 [Planctomycetota bacterium]
MSKRKGTTEAKLENTRRYVRAFGEMAGFMDRIDDVRHAIQRGYAEAIQQPPSFDSHGSILGRESPRQEQVSRKAAWIASHRLGSRAFCVMNQLVQCQAGRYFSPLLQQVEMLGYPTRPVPFESFVPLAKQRRAMARIDALFVDPVSMRLTVVKGCSVEQLQRRLDRDASVMEENLWVRHRQLALAREVPTKHIATLVLAEMILRSALPDWDVDTMLVAVEREDCSWNYEGIQFSGTALAELAEQWNPVREEQVIWSADAAGVLAFGSTELDRLPRVPAKEPLNGLPVDRATRCRMVLETLWLQQAGVDGLAVGGRGEIATAVEDRYLIHYSQDLRRHDFEDCLAIGGFIERPRYAGKCYALTPLGVFEALLSRRQIEPEMRTPQSPDPASHLVSSVHNQARLWARYTEGEQVIVGAA